MNTILIIILIVVLILSMFCDYAVVGIVVRNRKESIVGENEVKEKHKARTRICFVNGSRIDVEESAKYIYEMFYEKKIIRVTGVGNYFKKIYVVTDKIVNFDDIEDEEID